MKRLSILFLCLNLAVAILMSTVVALSWRWPIHFSHQNPTAQRGFTWSINAGRLSHGISTGGKAGVLWGRNWASWRSGDGQFSFSVGRQVTFTGGGTFAMVSRSAWPLVTMIALLWLYPLYRLYTGPLHRHRFGLPGHCRKCGYDLQGNQSGVCPECGTEIKGAQKKAEPVACSVQSCPGEDDGEVRELRV